jgi:DNA-binding HxlR family transcriptional regulator
LQPGFEREKRSYRQYCPVARALDLLGERWTLLLVRDLLTGPKRFKDLLGSLQGIGANLLSARLKQFEEEGLVRRTALPPPVASTVYELTEAGQALEPALLELARWGQRYLKKADSDLAFQPCWILLGLKARFRPEAARGVRAAFEFRVGGEVFHAEVRDGRIETRYGPAAFPDLVLTAEVEPFLRLSAGEVSANDAAARGEIRVEGSPESLALCGALFGLPATR